MLTFAFFTIMKDVVLMIFSLLLQMFLETILKCWLLCKVIFIVNIFKMIFMNNERIYIKYNYILLKKVKIF